MRLSDDERGRLDELVERVKDECEHALGDLSDENPKMAVADETVYELDGAVTDLFEYLNESGIADRAVKWSNSRKG